jgi:hypothetical protein
MPFDDSKIREGNALLESRLLKDRKDWGDKITDLVSKIKNIDDLSECQVIMLSYRQILLDKVSEFKTTIYKRNNLWERHYKTEWRSYSLNYDMKLTNSEKSQFIKADLSELRVQIRMLETHIDYYQECIKTLDNMAFAIRNRITLENDH